MTKTAKPLRIKSGDTENRALNLQLMRVRLVPLGSPDAYLDAEGKLLELLGRKLYQLVLDTPSLRKSCLPPEQKKATPEETQFWASQAARAVSWDLLRGVRDGRTVAFSNKYLLEALARHDKLAPSGASLTHDPADPRTARARAEDGPTVNFQALGDELFEELEGFRLQFGPDERDLFDAWAREGNDRGWQTRFAKATGASNATVYNRKEELRARAHRATGIEEVEMVIEYYHHAKWGRQAPFVPTKRRAPVAIDYATQWAGLERAFQDQPCIQDLVRFFKRGLSEVEVLHELFDLPWSASPEDRDRATLRLEEQLLVIHCAYVVIYQGLEQGAEAEGFYGRLLAQKLNVATGLAKAEAASERQRALARKVQQLAQGKVPFQDLPARLQLRPDEVISALLALKKYLSRRPKKTGA